MKNKSTTTCRSTLISCSTNILKLGLKLKNYSKYCIYFNFQFCSVFSKYLRRCHKTISIETKLIKRFNQLNT